jgi:FixJ family two-component response regulator
LRPAIFGYESEGGQPSLAEVRWMELLVPTVFLIDDDEAVRDSLGVLLESHGLSVKSYASCPEFLAGYIAEPESCLLLDLHLPNMTGLDLLEQFPPERLGMPVILISGRADAASRQRALGKGVRTVLDKPFTQEALMAAIAQAIGPGSCGAHGHA